MAKVFATFIANNEVVLKTWSSANLFSKSESWIDEKFIYIATSDDFKNSYLSPAMFDSELENSHEKSIGNGFNLLHTDTQRIAHKLMFEARKKYLKL